MPNTSWKYPPPSCFTLNSGGLLSELATPVFIAQEISPGDDNVGLPPNAKQFNAIWDTGATNTCITERVVAECGLKPTGAAPVAAAGREPEVRDTYLIDVFLPNKVVVPSVPATHWDQLGGNSDILIGMDIISQGDFLISNYRGQTRFTFRIPSLIEKIDFSKNPAALMSYPGDKSCPCGKGKRFKKCCGRV